jgi:hypothetical protein
VLSAQATDCTVTDSLSPYRASGETFYWTLGEEPRNVGFTEPGRQLDFADPRAQANVCCTLGNVAHWTCPASLVEVTLVALPA